MKFFLQLCCSFFIFCLSNYSLYAQCGTSPTSGTVTITTANTIVNSYYPATGSPTAGTTAISVGTIDVRGAGTAIAAGDLIVIIQMQGADINTANTVAYGGANASAPANGYTSNGNLVAGYYEYATVSTVSGSPITTVNVTVALSHNYYTRAFTSTTSIQAFQVLRVPRYYNLTINSAASITAPAWNGSTGGVVVLDAAATIAINGSINVAGLGFRGGGGKQLTGATSGDGNSSTNVSGGTNLVNTDYRYNSPITNVKNVAGGAKGEGIAGTPAYTWSLGATTTTTGSVEGYINGSMGRGAPGNAAGGGTDGQPLNQNQSNTGGGGGANAGAGGQGGSGWPAGNGAQDSSVYPYGGYGGAAFTQGTLQRIIMGGGGGAGTANNSSSTNEYNSSGAPGGGIIVARALLYSGSGSVIADGAAGPGVTQTYTPAQTDAAGGGGGGGTIVLVTINAGATVLGSITASAKGGTGGYMTTYYNHGPGGGGGGGYIYTNGTLGSTAVSGGLQGFTRSGSSGGLINNTYNTSPGANGMVVTLSGAPAFYCGVLPVVLTSFTAAVNTGSVNLYWHIENEIGFSYFEIEFSTDGINFSPIGSVNYLNNVPDYHFIHESPQPGKNFYRLRLVDMDGKYTYSNILPVNIGSNENELLIYPNPVSNYISLQLHSDSRQLITVVIFDNVGQRLIYKNILAEKGDNYIFLPDVKNLPSGIYLIKVNTGSKMFVEKFVVEKK
jgi:type IX secretion system substrate protein